MTTSLNYNSSCVHFGGIQYDKIVILYLEEIYFFSFFLGNYSFFTWVFSASGSCWTFERRVSAVCTARNAHLDCARTSFNSLQLTRTAVQHDCFFPDRDETALFWYFLSCIVTYIDSESQSHGWCPMSEFPHHFLHWVWFARVCFFVGFPTTQIYFSRKSCAEYASGVSGACYACNQSYRRCIYSMCCVLYTCVGMHMLTGPRDYAVPVKMCVHSIL